MNKFNNLRKNLKKLTKLKKAGYWLFVLLVFTAQIVFTFKSTNKIRLEELAESVRNVFWLQKRTIYDGISSNVGWYGTLLVLYNIFGFWLFEAKHYRLVIHLIALLCSAKLLKKYLGEKKAALLLLIIGFSPTLLYFNTLQTSFGLDLQYFPILLYLVLSIDFSKPAAAFIKQFILWSLAMVASMSYPTFLAYLPVLLIIYLHSLFKSRKGKSLWFVGKNCLISLASFCLPIVIVFNYLLNPQLLIYDNHVKSGLFRGGGGKVASSFFEIKNNVYSGSKEVLKDLFLFPDSYYFESDIVRSEFSHQWLKWIVIFILLASIWLVLKNKKARWPIILSWFLMGLSLVVGNVTGDLPGIRRSTGVLAGFYAAAALVWKYMTAKHFLGKWLNFSVALCLFLIAVHHIKVYPNNLLAFNLPSRHAADSCFNKIPGDPDKSFNYYLKKVRQGWKIYNPGEDDHENNYVCRLHAVYSTTAGACFWNHLNCPPIWGYDETSGGFILLSTSLWDNYYFGH